MAFISNRYINKWFKFIKKWVLSYPVEFMRQMFRIEEIIVVSIEHFIDWPAKIIDVLYYQNQI